MEVYIIVIAFLVGITGARIVSGGQLEVNTCDRIQGHGYPCENHTVITPDGYILTLFRLPQGGLEMSDKGEPRPAVLIMHCLLCSSDFFVLNGPNDGLPFMLADAGYDVWLGNARGNIYSQRHTNLSSLSEDFWNFSLDEIGLIDVPTKIDYILKTTSVTKLHYIGFSQGTTVFMMLLSSQPSYGEKIKTAHLLGPGVYFCHLRSPPALLIQKFLGRPSGLANVIGTLPSQGFTGILRLLGSNVCKFPLFTELCIEILNLFSGWDSPYLNRTLLTDLLTSTPADGSNQQINQYMQFITKCEFKRYDYGEEGNLRKYGEAKPRTYDLKNIHLDEAIEFYFADNDFFATPEDIHRLFEEIGMRGNWNRCDRITRHGYPCEEHTVTTSDGYILALYRIPNGHAGNRLASGEIKPVVFLMHCLFCSSDIFVLVGPNDGLPFMLADAGFDVWIGNTRGNVYSQRHTSLSPFSKEFWAFSLDEIALIDLPTEIEYVLEVTGQPRLNYIGYSQGTTTLAILLSTKPNFAKKLKAVHLLAPAIYLCHVRSPPVLWLARYFGTPSSVTSFFATLPSQRAYGLIRALSSGLCQNPQVTELCVRILNTFTGFDSPYMNRTLIPELLITTPADGSNQQSHHFFQFITTCEFKAFDFGTEGNMAKYGSKKPPPYDVRNIRTEEPIEFYFSDNDFLAPPEDVEHLHSLMGDRDHWNRVRYSKYNHFDFTIASNVKSCINDCVVDRLQRYEGRPYAGNLCTCFKKKPFRK